MEKNTAIPKASSEPVPKLEAFLRPLASVFRRSTSTQSMERYVTGLLTDLEHKTCETIASTVAGTSTERLQHLLTDAVWEATALDEQRVREMIKVSPAGGILIVDDTGLPKKGKRSPGVALQYSGTLGKVGNCQVMVSAQYAADEPQQSRPQHWPVSARVYLPESWAQDRPRCRRAHIPDEVTFQTKGEIALDLVDRARAWGVPFGVVSTDAGYGNNPGFLEALEERSLSYLCGIERCFGVRLPEPLRMAEESTPSPYRGRGRPSKPRPASLCTAQEVAEALPDSAWQSISWREGRPGTLSKQFVAVRVHRATGRHGERAYCRPSRVKTGPQGWLLAERPLPGQEGKRKWYYSNLPADTPLQRLATLAHSRWIIEQFYEEAKGECGLDHFQGRRWDGLHRHWALVMLTYSFLSQQRILIPQSPQGFFPPYRGASEPPGNPSSDHALALDGSHPLLH
jgi:SRSO17 transposase